MTGWFESVWLYLFCCHSFSGNTLPCWCIIIFCKLWYFLYGWFQTAYVFSFVECDKLIGIIWHKNMFSLLCYYAIYNVYNGILPFCWILITDKICCMSFNHVSFDLDWNDTIMSRCYFESWLNNSYSCLLFTVSSVSEKSSVLPYVAVLFLIQDIWQGNFFCMSIPNRTSVSGSLSHIMKLWVNLKSTILRWSAVIPKAVISDPSAVFNLVVVACIGVLKLLSIVWYVEYLMRDMATPESIRAL